MGKTALALNMAEHVAVDNGLPVALFSMEMGGTQLAMRMLGSISRVDQHRMRTGRLNDEEWQKLSSAMASCTRRRSSSTRLRRSTFLSCALVRAAYGASAAARADRHRLPAADVWRQVPVRTGD